MNVAVHYKRRQRRLQSSARGASILGDGLLERARSTSLALLGLTAAVGLAIVAVALNQSWPLIAGAPIPAFGDRQQAVGDATVAAEAKAPSDRGAALRSVAGRQGSKVPSRPPREGAGGTPAPAVSQPAGSESILVSRSTPVGSPGGGSPDDAIPSPPPAGQPPAVTPTPAAAPPAPTPAVSTPAQPPVTSVGAPPGQAPVPSAGAPPPESPEELDDDNDVDGDCPPEDEWDDGHDHSHGWHRGHDHDW